MNNKNNNKKKKKKYWQVTEKQRWFINLLEKELHEPHKKVKDMREAAKYIDYLVEKRKQQ